MHRAPLRHTHTSHWSDMPGPILKNAPHPGTQARREHAHFSDGRRSELPLQQVLWYFLVQAKRPFEFPIPVHRVEWRLLRIPRERREAWFLLGHEGLTPEY